MHEVSSHSTPHTEGARRLHAVVRGVLSPGVWLLLVVQLGLILSMPWQAPQDASLLTAVMTLVFPVLALLAFFFLQAGAYRALTLSRRTLSVGEVLREAPKVFTAFVWLTIKAGLLFALILNVVVLAIMLTTGMEFEALIKRVAALFNPLTGVLAFVFAYWLPTVFTRSEFRLLPSLQQALWVGWRRLAQAGFLVFLILAPVAVAVLLPAGGPIWSHLLLNLISALMGWIAYIYCIDVLQPQPPDVAA